MRRRRKRKRKRKRRLVPHRSNYQVLTRSFSLEVNVNHPFIPPVITPLSLLAWTRPGDNRWAEELPVVRVMYGLTGIYYLPTRPTFKNMTQ